jgi:thioredoxin reductase (NADPH)
VALDAHGFILTGTSVPGAVIARGDFAGREPMLFETSVPGVFAVGDVRSGSTKRVAAAVGEGSSVAPSILSYLTEHQ